MITSYFVCLKICLQHDLLPLVLNVLVSSKDFMLFEAALGRFWIVSGLKRVASSHMCNFSLPAERDILLEINILIVPLKVLSFFLVVVVENV